MTPNSLTLPEHPGVYLQKKFLVPLGLAIEVAAQAMDLSLEWLSAFVEGRHAVTTEVAYRLAYFVGGTAGDWIARQARYDVASQPAPVYSAPRFESAYWGQLLGLLSLDTPIGDRTLRALAAVSFSAEGGLQLTLTERGTVGDSDVSFHFEHTAISLIRALAKAGEGGMFLEGSLEGFEYACKRIKKAWAALAPEKVYLTNLTDVARIQWFDYSRQKAQAGQVVFGYENVPSWSRWHRDGELVTVLGQPTMEAIHRSLTSH